jgi:N-formylglutamate amidohydrolase
MVSAYFVENDELKIALGVMGFRVHVDAVHAAKPKSDLLTGELVEKIVSLYPCSGIIAKISRQIADLNRAPIADNPTSVVVTRAYRDAIHRILEHNQLLDEHHQGLWLPYLHIALHGMRDDHNTPHTIELGTRYGQSCAPEVRDWAVLFL